MGLADPGRDVPALMRHGAYLMDRFPGRTLAFSLPRIHSAPDGFQAPFPVDDQQLIRWYCALRIAFPRAELVLSTREPVALRNRLAQICITQMSAGSSTAPGGYEDGAEHSGEQFPVTDQRSPAEVARWLEEAGFHVWWSLDGSGTRA
jgi:2-iminoacetate synthase